MNVPDLIPVRMINEYMYCPRLAFLEWVQSEFIHNFESMEGKLQHKRADTPGYTTKRDEDGEVISILTRTVKMSSEKLHLITVIDVLDESGDTACPVEYKHGSEPNNYYGAWDNDRVQLCAQGLILCDNGYHSDHGYIYYFGSKRKVRIDFDQVLIELTLLAIEDIRSMAQVGKIPPPLDDSPKCPKCSLVTICLPEETHALESGDGHEDKIRRLLPPGKDAKPLYVTVQGSRVSKSGDSAVVQGKGIGREFIRFIDMTHLAVFGGIQVTTPLVHALCNMDIPIVYFSHGGWFYGITSGLIHKNVELRRNQYHCIDDESACLAIARHIVHAKIKNSRTLLRRNAKSPVKKTLKLLAHYAQRALEAGSSSELLGIEGNAAREYFQSFNSMIRTCDGASVTFSFEHRNRRPPKDPVNAMLSFAYALLTKDFVVTLNTIGFDPYMGFYHSMKYGRPALALDLMEMFRPIVADSVVLNVINNSIVSPDDFTERHGASNLNQSGRQRFLQAFERRMEQLITHPVFKYKVSYRQLFEIQCRLVGRYLSGEIREFPVFCTR